jgi:hypothetical protein
MPAIKASGPYIPRADGKLRDWLNNFARVVARSPAAVGLSVADAASLAAMAERYESAYLAATAPETRGRPAVREKNVARRAAWKTVRPLAMLIKHNRGVGDALKRKLGVYPPHRSQSPIKPPRGAPRLVLERMSRGVHRLRYHDPKNPSRFAKPRDVTGMQLIVLVGDEAARSPRGAHRVQNITRHVFDVHFAASQTGKTATYFGRWQTRRGLVGPWSPPLAMTIV